jgi:Prp8 binding protein
MTEVEAPPSKRFRVEDHDDDSHQQQLVSFAGNGAAGDVIRTSSLAQPTMKLSGHMGSVYSLAYDPLGECLCSGSFDMTCLLWSASGDCENFNVLKGHKNAILDLTWSNDSEHICTASADHHLGWFDSTTGTRIKRFMGHEQIVNAVDTCREGFAGIVASGSDDCTARLWDSRVRGDVGRLDHEFQVTSVAFSADANTLYTGGIDNCITAWDVRRLVRFSYFSFVYSRVFL